jgi:hypothetical protein
VKHVVLLHYQFSSESVGLFVVSWNGAELASSQISKCLPSTWGKAGLDSKINCTLIRKTAVSAVHEKAPQFKAQLADHMCHRQATAVKDHRITDREKSSLAAARHLSVAMRSTTEESVLNLPSASDTNTTPVEIETITSSKQGVISNHSLQGFHFF